MRLDRGYLQTQLAADEGEAVEKGIDRGKWREAILPAVSLLQTWGGGEVLIHHRPGDLVRDVED